MRRTPAAAVTALLLWAFGFDALLLSASWAVPVDRTTVLMALGLLLLWVLACGGLLWRFQSLLLHLALRLPLDWRLRFVLLSTLLALLEEAIATLMTNLGPLFGDASGQAFITASPNYWVVVSQHSVVVFVPMFVGWALMLSWRAFPPFAVLLLFGVSGLLAEVLAFGPQNLLAAGFWMLVYGLMVDLPAHTVPRGATRPRSVHAAARDGRAGSDEPRGRSPRDRNSRMNRRALLGAALLVLALLSPARACNAITPDLYALTQQAAKAYGLHEWIMTSLIWVESKYCPDAVSGVGAQGLGQLMPDTAREMGVTSPFDPAQNLYGSARYLRLLYDTYHDWPTTLAAYHAGPANVAAGRIGPVTQAYVANVLGTYAAIARQGGLRWSLR